MNKEILTIWHQGKHRCQVKPGHKTIVYNEAVSQRKPQGTDKAWS